GGGEASRLYQKLVYEKQAAQNASAWAEPAELGSVFTIEATARPGHTPAEMEQLLEAELERLRRDGPEAAELEAARNTLQLRMIRRLETAGGTADTLNYYNHYLGKPDYVGEDIRHLRSVSASDIRKFAQRLEPNTRVVVYGISGKQKLEDVPKPSKPTADG